MTCNSNFNHLKGVSGIYMFYTKIDPRIYIGSSNNLFRRLKRHYSELKNNCHYNRHLQRFVNKYGIENLEFRIIEFCKIEDLLKRETELIKDYDSIYFGFNMTMPDNSEKSKEVKISIAQARRNCKFNKIIEVILDGKLIFSGNISSIIDKFGVDSSSVYKILKGERKMHKKMSFREKITDNQTLT